MPALLAVLVLLWASAIAAPAAAAYDVTGAPSASPETATAPSPEPVVVDAPATPQQPASVQAEPEPVGPPAAEPEPPAAETPTVEPEPPPGQPPPPQGSGEPTAVGMAHNSATVVQVVVQVQRGCQRNCRGTSQRQEAVQRSEVVQDAQSVGQDGAVAVNESRTIQFVWQQQLGCVAFCYDTSQVQSASQTALTTQSAEAVGEALALALNDSETRQLVWQLQEGCVVECHGASSLQLVNQEQRTDQTAGASAASGNPDEFLVWLNALATNIGATLQTIFQFEDADCLEDCIDGVQIQLAVQNAATTQTATVEEPDLPTPPAAEPAQSAAAPETVAWDEPAAEPPVLAAASPLHRDAGRAERAQSRPLTARPGHGASPPPSANWGARRSMAAGGVPAASVDRTTGGRPAAGPSHPATRANAPIDPGHGLGALGLDTLDEETAENAANVAIPALLAVFLLALGGALLTVRTLNGARGV